MKSVQTNTNHECSTLAVVNRNWLKNNSKLRPEFEKNPVEISAWNRNFANHQITWRRRVTAGIFPFLSHTAGASSGANRLLYPCAEKKKRVIYPQQRAHAKRSTSHQRAKANGYFCICSLFCHSSTGAHTVSIKGKGGETNGEFLIFHNSTEADGHYPWPKAETKMVIIHGRGQTEGVRTSLLWGPWRPVLFTGVK